MNDDQCQALSDTIRLLINAVQEGSEKIANAIDDQYCTDNGGIEKRLEKLMDTLWDISDRHGSY
jgi:hypothetical protein